MLYSDILDDKEELYQIMEKATAFYWKQWQQPTSKAAIAYLKQRGLLGTTVREFSIGYAPPGWNNLLKNLATSHDQQELMLKAGLIKKSETGRYYDYFRNRIMFPIHDSRGQVIAFGGRLFTHKENEPKYLNSPETPLFQKGNELLTLRTIHYLKRRLRQLRRLNQLRHRGFRCGWSNLGRRHGRCEKISVISVISGSDVDCVR